MSPPDVMARTSCGIAAAAILLWTACDGSSPGTGGAASASATVPTAQQLHTLPPPPSAPEPTVMPTPRCQPGMVRVKRRFCIDRYESTLVTSDSDEPLSPYYTPAPNLARMAARIWAKRRKEVGSEKAQAIGLPHLALWQTTRNYEPKGVVRKAVVPNGHVTGKLAQQACENAGKRLCTVEEWSTACRGEQDRKFPYGDKYEHGKCNVFREGHPADILHDDASRGHSDPRLNKVAVNGRPLLRKTGATPSCVSKWEDDGIYDMVGNLDEWIDDPGGTFMGGFYSRSTKKGCDQKISGHPYLYADYSTGVRCCTSLPIVQDARGSVAAGSSTAQPAAPPSGSAAPSSSASGG